MERAEETTGLQFCVYLGSVDDDRPREHAEGLFMRAGLHEHPAVLIVVAPRQRRVEVVTGDAARLRLSDDDAAAAIATMTAAFSQGDLVTGLISGLDHLATRAGPGTRPPGADDLPNVVDE